MSREENQQQLHVLFESVGYRSSSHPVLVAANERSMSLRQFLSLTVDEVDEQTVEHKKWQATNDSMHRETAPHKDLLMEFVDVLVMLRSVRTRVAPGFSVEKTIFSNSDKPRADFDSIKEQIINIGEGRGEHNFQLLFGEFLLLIGHLNVELQASMYIELMNKKLNDNRESRFYQKEPGMTEADMLLKYDHVTAALRVLRNFLRKTTGQEMTLQPWITEHFKEQILGWHDSKLSMVLLQREILFFQQQIKDEMFWKLTPPRKEKKGQDDSVRTSINAGRTLSDPFFETKMLLAGAKLINNPNPEAKDKALQSRSSNATLGQTIFWV